MDVKVRSRLNALTTVAFVLGVPYIAWATTHPAAEHPTFLPPALEANAEMRVDAPADPSGLPVLAPDGPEGSLGSLGPLQADISRPVSESFERADVFAPGNAWRAFDTWATAPGFNDVVTWGRRDCVHTVGSYSVWSAGGGSLGTGLACGAEYPAPIPGRTGNGVRSELQFLFLDMLTVPAVGGIRITFDYMSQMPPQALFVGAGDFDERNAQNEISIRGRNDFAADTGGDWIRGDVNRVEIRNAPDFQITGKGRVLVAFVYSDPPPNGRGAPTSGMKGVTIDNVHLDVMLAANPGIIPSPTGTRAPTGTPTPTATRTRGSIVITRTPATPTPRRPTEAAYLAQTLNKVNLRAGYQAPPTVPTPSITPTRPPTATVTPFPTDTDEPTQPPPPTETSTRTPVPFPEVVISLILPLGDPEIARVTNQGTAPQDMTNWRLFEKARTHNCYFPAGLILGPGETWEFQSGGDAEAGARVTVCDPDRLIWDNNIDEGWLYNTINDRVDRWCYDRNGALPCGSS